MRYLALATDFDGVVASHGRPSSEALSAIKRLRSSGRKAILVTGRRLSNLLESCPDLTMFDYVVAENGAVVHHPQTNQTVPLAEPLSETFVRRLEELQVRPIEVGSVIVATWIPHQTAVLQAIQELGLEYHIIFNRAAVMVLPAGVNKATGIEYVLRKMGLSRHEVVGVGDSENDHSFLMRSECAATVANAVPSILRSAAIVTKNADGAGLAELIDQLIADDLSRIQGAVSRYLIPLGRLGDGETIAIPPYGTNILIAGPSGSGKSTIAAGLIERLMANSYQLCIVDPEGDYGTLDDVLTLGNEKHAVTVDEVLAFLEDPTRSLNVNLLGIPLADRPEFFGRLFPSLHAMRTRTGRPHWIVLDEAHHMLPLEWAHLGLALPQKVGETMLITVHPDHLAPDVLSHVDVIVAVGDAPRNTLESFAALTSQSVSCPQDLKYEKGKAVVWIPRTGAAPRTMEILRGRAERIRHHRKYAEGNMRHRSFFFRGPSNRHNLRAQNLVVFCQIAEGIGEETWLFHLHKGDYSRWLRNSVKDRYLADQVERIEKRSDLSPSETRELVRRLIKSRYTLPE